MTQDVLMGRGCAITLQCVLCNREIVETRDHIMRDCRYVKTFWQGLLMNFGLTVNRQSDQTMVRSWFTQAKEGKGVGCGLGGRSLGIVERKKQEDFSQQCKPVSAVINSESLDTHDWLHGT